MEKIKRFGLLGSGISYSLSPHIHGVVYEALGVNATYELVDIKVDMLDADFVAGLVDKFDGFNVTIPFKEKIIPFLDCVDDNALRVGAVNTVLIENNQLIGYNTDYSGFIYSVGLLRIDKLESAIVLGTGGAAKMAVQALLDLGVEKVIAVSRTGRTVKEARSMQYDQLEVEHPSSDILVNATPLGSVAHLNEMGVTSELLSRQRHVFDMIYKPEKTKLLLEAESMGIPCINGLDMLVVQALEADKIWLKGLTSADFMSISTKIKLQIK